MIPNVAEFLSSLIFAGSRPANSGYGTLENPAISLTDPATWDEFLAQSGEKSDSGLLVGPEQALRFGPVYQCCEVKSCDVASSTLHVHKTTVKPGEDDIDYSLGAERVCSLEWNEATPANEGWQNLVFHQMLWGNGYAYIARQDGRRNGPIQWMANLVPGTVKPVISDEQGLIYEVTVDGQTEYLNRWEVFHLKALAIQQHRALKLISLMRNELGLALAGKLYLSKFFERGGHHGGILAVPSGMDKKARENLEKGVEQRSSPKSWFKTMILRDGAKWFSSTVDPQSAQMHELNDDEARAVCHFFNVPPYKIGLKDSESYNSAEQAAKNYITGSLLHTCVRIQGEAQMKLLSERVRRSRSHEFRHNFSKLLEPDVKTMNEVLEIQRRNEIINANEYRAKIRLPARADKRASEYYNPNTGKNDKTKASTKDGNSAADSGNDPDSPDSSTDRQHRLSAEHAVLVAESIQRATKRLCTIARNKARKPADLLKWVDTHAAEHRSIVAEETKATMHAVYPGRLPSVMLHATESWIVKQVTSGVGALLEPPNRESDLQSNVDSFCSQFHANVFSQWESEFCDATQQ